MTRFRSLLVVLACGTIVATACGSDSKSSSTTPPEPHRLHGAAGAPRPAAAAAVGDTTPAATETTAAAAGGDPGLAAAKANVEKYSTFDGSIGVTIPLTGKPEKKTIRLAGVRRADVRRTRRPA